MDMLSSGRGRRLGSLGSTWEEYKGWFFLLFSAYVLWSLRGLFSAVGGAVGSGADAVLGGVTDAAQAKADKAKAKAAASAGGSKVDFTDAQIATFKADATSLANFLGRGTGVGMVDVFKDQQSAFSLIKQRYSRLNLYQNKPFKWHYYTDTGKALPLTQTVADANSVKNPYDWHVLVPFYSAASGGHDLLADFKYYVTDAKYKPFFKWIL